MKDTACTCTRTVDGKPCGDEAENDGRCGFCVRNCPSPADHREDDRG